MQTSYRLELLKPFEPFALRTASGPQYDNEGVQRTGVPGSALFSLSAGDLFTVPYGTLIFYEAIMSRALKKERAASFLTA